MGRDLGTGPENGEEGDPEQRVTLSHWVGASRENLRKGIRFLEHFLADAKEFGLIHLEQDGPWKESLIKGFGQPFYDSLMEWRGFNPCAILLQEHLDEHTRMFPSRPSDPPQPNRWTSGSTGCEIAVGNGSETGRTENSTAA